MHKEQRSLWDILGTQPTGDERALKRAYAKRLKVTRPEDDPAAFQELREAYEYALRHASRFAVELQEPQSAEAEAAEVPEAPPMEPADLWGVIDEAAQEQFRPPEQWGMVAIDPAQEAAMLWQGCLELARHADASDVLAGMLQDDAMLNLDVREEFELCALRYCASAGYDLGLRQALFEQLGWNHDFSYLTRSHADLVRSAVQRYRADRSFDHFSDNRDSYPGLDCIMSQQQPSAYARQLFDQKFTLQLRELLHAIRWQHAEMLAYKLDTDLFEQWEQAVHAKRYFKQTALASGGLGFVLHFMLAGVLDAAGLKLGDTAAYASLLGFQALAFLLLAMNAWQKPAPAHAWMASLGEELHACLPVLSRHPGLGQLGWLMPFLCLALLLLLPAPGAPLRIATSVGLCLTALLAAKTNYALLRGRLLACILIAFAATMVFTLDKADTGLAMSDGIMLLFCVQVLALRSMAGLYVDCGGQTHFLPRLRTAWIVGCAIAFLATYLHAAPAHVLGAMLFVWSCIGMLFAPFELNWRAAWPLVIAPAAATFLLASQPGGPPDQAIIKLSAVLALSVLYFTVRHLYLQQRRSAQASGLS
ncbi:J domain-containing protein [Janthinobacterium sp. UMAB-56]|uniref:J domain-containing protein n=1 Tax=Janthinobacterium sp. UMAB-56 TaxID=1365361 RepID=UPI001C59E1E0|nr:J domain-containing protein [Janthinobacterium sp. UMAB-56]